MVAPRPSRGKSWVLAMLAPKQGLRVAPVPPKTAELSGRATENRGRRNNARSGRRNRRFGRTKERSRARLVALPSGSSVAYSRSPNGGWDWQSLTHRNSDTPSNGS